MRDTIQEAYLDIVTQELEEGKLKNMAIAVGAAGAIAAGTMYSHINQRDKVSPGIIQAIQKPARQDPEYLKKTILDKFKKVDPDKVDEIVNAAIKHSHPVFPQAHHLLALAGIESSFNEKAVSQLKHDPAVGLLQTRPKVWNIHPKELSTIDGQIKHGAHILQTYHTKTGDIDKAIQAYNVGITNFNRGKMQDAARRYLAKFKSELSRY